LYEHQALLLWWRDVLLNIRFFDQQVQLLEVEHKAKAEEGRGAARSFDQSNKGKIQ